MIHLNHTEINETTASNILENQVNEVLLTLLEQEITTYCLNNMEDIRRIHCSTDFGKYVKVYFRQIRNAKDIEDEVAAKIFLELYIAIRANRYIILNDILKSVLLNFIYDKQQCLSKYIHEKPSDQIFYMAGDYINSIDAGTEIYISQVKIHPSEDRKYIYNCFREKNPEFSKKDILQRIYTYEKVRYVYSRICKDTEWELEWTDAVLPYIFSLYDDEWYGAPV